LHCSLEVQLRLGSDETHSRFVLPFLTRRCSRWQGVVSKSCGRQLAVSSPEYYACCDGCSTNLSIHTRRLVCTVCEDRDLCRSCFDKLESNELREASSSCRGHRFLKLDGISIVRSSSTDNANNSVLIEQWLKDIADL
jgi:hypothetical protein